MPSGGVTTLAAADLNDHEIPGVGDWKSNSYLTNVRKNIRLFENARKALASPTAIASTAVRRMYGSRNSKFRSKRRWRRGFRRLTSYIQHLQNPTRNPLGPATYRNRDPPSAASTEL